MKVVLKVVDHSDHGGDREIGLQNQEAEKTLANGHSHKHGVAHEENDPCVLISTQS